MCYHSIYFSLAACSCLSLKTTPSYRGLRLRLLVTHDTSPVVQRCANRKHLHAAEHKSHRHFFFICRFDSSPYIPFLLVPAPGGAGLTGELESHKLYLINTTC